MRTDSLVMPVPLSAPLSLVAAAGTNIASSIIDLLGLGVGISPALAGQIIGTTYNQQFGTDFGIGTELVKMDIVIGVGLVTANGCTLNLAMQGAPDTGLTGNWLPGTWQTLVETGPLTAAQCVANTRIARWDWPPSFPETMPPPRYIRLLAQVPAAENFTVGTIAFALGTNGRDDFAQKYAARGYSVS
jgi:hypothetical protein